jgi:hypothetical protein
MEEAGLSSCGSFDVGSSGVRCLLAARRSRAVSGAAFPASVFREASSLIRDSMEFNTRVSMSCELGIVRGSILVSLVYQEPKISCEAFSRSGLLGHCVKKTLCFTSSK